MHDLLGTAVKFKLTPSVVLDAIVVGFEHPKEDESPKLHLVYPHPDKHYALTGSQWAQAFDHAYSVPHIDDSTHEYGWDLAPGAEEILARDAANSALRGEISTLQSDLANTTEGRDKALQDLADAGAKTPSAADLDAVAKEQEAVELTKGPAKAKIVAKGK